MRQEIILSIINKELKDLFENVQEITIDKNFLSTENNIGLSSFDTMLLLIKLEERFNIEIPPEIRSIKSLVQLIESRGEI